MRSIFTMIFLLAWPAHAANNLQIQMAATVYSKPDFDSPVIVTLAPGNQISVSSKIYGGFRKIKVVSGGHSYVGYITASDLSNQTRPPKEKKWGVGAGLLHTRLSQGEKSFKTDDEVEYKISGYSGSNTNPALSAQFGQKQFWRLDLAYRTVDLEGEANTGIAGAQNPKIKVQYKMAAFGAQVGWGLFSDIFYAGAGIEVAKALSGKVKFGTQDLSNQADYPDYLSGHVFSGAQLRIGTSLSLYLEGRLGLITNQQPVINVMEVAASLLYWP